MRHSQRQESHWRWRWWCIRFAAGDNKQKPQIDGPGFLKETKQKQQLPLPVVTMASKRISGERIAPF
ncbi:hypothetical protein AOY72_15080 [Escherichia coli]|nr:hypothetical protein AOY72_15080 [Escherichia coli]